LELTPQGYKEFPIWLIGDSDPEKYVSDLEFVFDDRHPTVHNIWIPILYTLQKKYYYDDDRNEIFNDEMFYIDNAVHDKKDRPKDNDPSWKESDTFVKENSDNLKGRMETLKSMIEEKPPKMIITFGAFAFEFIRRCEKKEPYHKFVYWNTEKLGKQFIESIDNFSIIDKVNIVPLLHRSISSKNFVSSHKHFTNTRSEGNTYGNYFEFVSELLFPKFREIFESPETQELIKKLKSK
jgi:hypothetical protein